VRAEFDRILRFWFDLGIAGFRIDVCHIIVKDALLRDNPPATDRDTGEEQLYGQKWLYNANRPEVHDVLRHWREIANEYDPPRVFVGETPVDDFAQLAAFYGQGDELQLAFNFAFIAAPLTADAMRPIAEAVEAALPADAWPAWTGSNHDMARLSSRWANNDPRAVRAALLMMLTLRGTPVLYQGDEIGLGDVEVVPPYLRDPLGVAYYPAYAGRDSARTPMQWRDAPGGGFTDDDVTPWLPLGDTAARNVADQVDDPASILTFVRAVIACRRATPTLQLGSYETLPGPDGAWAWRRGNDHVVAVNLGENAITIDLGAGAILIGTELARIGESVDGLVALGPWEGVVLTTA
jgi:alpha-glucosidase